MTDKATVEIPVAARRHRPKINFKDGDICPVGAVLVVIEEGDKPSNSAGSTLDQAPSANPNLVPTGDAAPSAPHALHEQHAPGRKRPASDDRPTLRMSMDGAVARERVRPRRPPAGSRASSASSSGTWSPRASAAA